ncbi:MAG: hypothetical protein GF331_15000 [Chitinivibrionales bacterium]|nr:hypothetical protein [Chitinivibrionales bacterium]
MMDRFAEVTKHRNHAIIREDVMYKRRRNMKRVCQVCTLVLIALVQAALPAAVSIDESVRYQTIEGLGAFMDVAPWKEKQGPFFIDVDLEAQGIYDTLVSELGATFMRFDFVGHSGDDFLPSPGNYNHAALSPRLHLMRKLLDAAARQREPLEFFASIFSPPGWMKDGGVTACGVEASPSLSETTCKLSIGMEDEFAEYLAEFATTIGDSTDLPLYALSIQNEPAFSEPYASCVYDGPRYRDVLKVVGSHFRGNGLNTRFFGAEHMSWAFPSGFEQAVRNDAEALGYMHAWAVHGYTDGVETDTGAYSGSTPTDKPLWMTETQGDAYGVGMTDWSGAMTLAGNLLSYLRDARITGWTWGSVQHVCGAAGCEETSDNSIGLLINGTPTDKYYVSRHFFRFIRPGARQIASSCDDNELDVVAFRHAENDCWTVVLRNSAGGAKTVDLSGAGIPGEWTMEVSTASTKRAQSTVGSSGISIPGTSVVTLVSGQYAHTEPVSAARHARSPRAVRTAAAARMAGPSYSLSGRRIDSARPGTRGVFVNRDGLHVIAGRRGRGGTLAH